MRLPARRCLNVLRSVQIYYISHLEGASWINLPITLDMRSERAALSAYLAVSLFSPDCLIALYVDVGTSSLSRINVKLMVDGLHHMQKTM